VLSVNCPTCGSKVSFRYDFSTHAVCGACDSLLVRQGSQADLIGKVAELQPDGSPLRLGAQGQNDGKSFELIGRIQLSYGDGFWNEWYLLYTDGTTGWLGEAMGEYFINTRAKTSGGLPGPRDLAPGDGLSLSGEAFVATGSITSTLISYEGELPFVPDSHEPFVTTDLRSASGAAATIDYSESPPVLFMGLYKPFDAFSFQGLRAEGEGQEEGASTSLSESGVSNFNCPSCGAAHSVSGGVRSKVLVCEYCGSAVDISNSKLQIIWKEQSMREEVQRGVSLPLGSLGKIDGRDFQVIGFIKKSVTYEGIKYPWLEYLLYNRFYGYRWLVESEGHFTFMEPMEKLPTRGSGPVTRPDEQAIVYEGQTFRHFQTSNPRVDAVAGEFYWRIRKDEEATNFDYICPPNLLSLEASRTGYVWSYGRYLNRSQVCEMFGLQPKQLKDPLGVAPCQPNPYEDSCRSNWKVFWAAVVVGMLLMVSGFLAGRGTVVWSTSDQYKTFAEFQPKESEKFSVKGGGNLAFDFEGRLNQRWLFFDTALVDAGTGKEVTKVGMTVENYFGQGEPKRTIRVSGIPAGDYKVRWIIKSGTTTAVPDKVDAKAKQESVTYKITLRRGVPVWGWFWLMLMVLLPLPLFESARRSSFETKRWYSSDHS
jgi:hypothetical protein